MPTSTARKRPAIVETTLKPLSKPAVMPGSGQLVYFSAVTPEIAQDILDNKNNRNRDLKGQGKIDELSRDMESGNFHGLNGETVIFSTKGELLDGQHRLYAVAKSGVTQTLIITDMIDEATQVTVDNGSKRTTGDQLKIKKVMFANEKAAIASRVLMFQRTGRIADRGANAFKPSQQEIMNFVDANEAPLNELIELSRDAWLSGEGRALSLFSPALIRAVHYIARQELPEYADIFFDRQMLRGIDLGATSPARAIRRFNTTYNAGSLHQTAQYTLLASVWNAYMREEDMTTVTMPKNGSTIVPDLIYKKG